MEKSTIKTYNQDCLQVLKNLPDKSADVFYLDPPYLYLKNQKLERPFNEVELFEQIARILKPNGWVICFGRGDSFYRWNLEMAKNGLQFKEEVVWNKRQGSSPLHKFTRIHELVSLRCKGEAPIQLNRVPYQEMRIGDFKALRDDLLKLQAALNNPVALQNLQRFLDDNIDSDGFEIKRNDRYKSDSFTKFSATCDSRESGNRTIDAFQSIVFGLKEKSIMQSGALGSDNTIMEQVREHYDAIHPTQKPPRLIERLLALIIPKGAQDVVVIDPFAGSFGCGIVCKNLNYHYIGCEIDEEYFNAGNNRLQKHQPIPPTQTLF